MVQIIAYVKFNGFYLLQFWNRIFHIGILPGVLGDHSAVNKDCYKRQKKQIIFYTYHSCVFFKIHSMSAFKVLPFIKAILILLLIRAWLRSSDKITTRLSLRFFTILCLLLTHIFGLVILASNNHATKENFFTSAKFSFYFCTFF